MSVFSLSQSKDQANVHGSMQDQRARAVAIQTGQMPPLEVLLLSLIAAEEECVACNVEENDYTILSAEDLRWELDLLKSSIGRRIAFVENQVSSLNFS